MALLAEESGIKFYLDQHFSRFVRADKLQVYLRLNSLLRAWVWRLWGGMVVKNFIVGSGLVCIGWPHITNRNGSINIGSDCSLGAGILKSTSGAKVVIGDRVNINNNFLISANNLISIGNDVLIGELVSVRDANHIFDDRTEVIGVQGVKSAPVFIEDDVWVGRGVVILPGVTIGHGAVIAANSVVNKSVDAFNVVGGVPARVLGERG